jgi:signal transduction histidine kinase
MRTHLVLPVWTSNMETFHVTLELLSEKNDSNKQNNINTMRVDLGIMGVAVLGIHPFEELDWTICDSNPTHFNSKRFSFIRQYYEIFAAYVADDWLYRRLRQMDYRRTEEMAKDAVHRINNPLGRLKHLVRNLFNELDEKNQRNVDHIYEKILIDLRSMGYYTNILTEMISDKKKTKENIIRLTQNVVNKFNENHEIEVLFDSSTHEIPFRYIYKNALNSILHELIYNSFKIIQNQKGGWIRVSLSDKIGKEIINNVQCSESKCTLITVEDNGGGIDPDFQQYIFDRGFTKSGSGGTGYGLFRVKQLVENELDGEIVQCGEWGKGAKFVILF